MVLLFFETEDKLNMSESFVKKLCETADMVKCIFALHCRRVRSPMVRGTLEIKCKLQLRFPPNFTAIQ